MTRTLLVETVTANSMADLVAARDAASHADMVELRLDGIPNIDVAQALADRRIPAIVTCRASWEGGRFDGGEQEREAILEQALALGAEFVDVEWKAGFADLIARDPRRIVLSSHDFSGVPRDLHDRARAMRATGVGTVKLAVATKTLSESLPLRDLARAGDAVVIAMGEAGVASRLLATRFGSKWTYAGHAVAPGQIPARRMIDDYGVRRVGPSTRLFGVVSTNALHSLSPVMHNAAFAAANLDAVYVPLRAADFADFLAFAEAMDVEGASITIPFKRDALAASRSADDLTRQVGAANTLRRASDGAWEATNTDVPGLLAPLEERFGRLAGVRASVLGAGGAGRAAVVALRSRGADVTLHARRVEQALEVTGDVGGHPGDWPPAPGSWDLLVNTTPLGGATLREESPVPAASLEGAFVYDLTYGDGDSRLIREARAAGCRTLDGLPMLIAQAELQFAWWTGQRPKGGVMETAIRRRLGLPSTDMFAGVSAERVL